MTEETDKQFLERCAASSVHRMIKDDPDYARLFALAGAETHRERIKELAAQYAACALKCRYCGDVRHTYEPGGCTGETKYRKGDRYRELAFLDGEYAAMRYFEKHICRAVEMTTKEAIEAFAADILTALGEPTPQPMEKVKDGGGYTS